MKGCLGCRGVRGLSGGVRGIEGWYVDWESDHNGPQSKVPALPGSPWGVTYLTKARQGPLSRVPSLPLVSLAELPTLPRLGK